MLASVAARCLSRPLVATLVLGVLTIGLGAGLPRVRTEFGYRPLLGADHPEIRRLESFIDLFGGGFPVWVAWRCGPPAPCGRALDERSLSMARQLEARLEGRPEVRSVHGPASTSLLVPNADGFAVRRLYEGGGFPADGAVLAERALKDPSWLRRLVSADGQTGALIVQPVDAESRTSERLVDALFEALAPFEAQGFQFHLVGHAVEFAVAGRELAASSARLTPVTLIVIVGVLLLLLRSWRAVAATVFMLGLAIVWAFGLLGWLGWPQDGVLQTLAPLVLVVGVCDAIHLISRLAARLDQGPGVPSDGPGRRRLVLDAVQDVACPCLVTSATTALAFLSFATSDLATFEHFGVVAAFAVAACALLSFSALPLLLAVTPLESLRRRDHAGAWELQLEGLARWALRRRTLVLGTAAVASVFCAAGWIAFLRVDTDGVEMYGERSQVVRWIRFVEKHLARADTLELLLIVGPDRALVEPEVLGGVDALGASLSTIDGLGRASSVTESMKWLRRVLHGDRVSEQRLGDRAAGNAELLELLAFEDPDALAQWVSFDRTRLRLSVEAEFRSAARRGPLLLEVREAASRLLPAGIALELTGPFAVGHAWVRDVQATQLRSFATALLLVFAAVAAHMRSVRWAALALVPTLLPALVVLGTLAWAGMSLDVGRAMIAAVILGIGVDDTVHLLDRIRLLRARGLEIGDAVVGAVRFTGRAVVTTSLALSLGFLSLMTSSWQTVSSFGFFVGIGILLALVADLIVLPALVGTGARR